MKINDKIRSCVATIVTEANVQQTPSVTNNQYKNTDNMFTQSDNCKNYASKITATLCYSRQNKNFNKNIHKYNCRTKIRRLFSLITSALK